jgi:glycine/D-amino acid oxidase-like deaminating enzyme
MTTTDVHARVIVLCERLTAATLGRDAEWRTDGDDQYVWQREEGSVTIGARDRDGQPPYELAVFNDDSEKVEELASALVEDDLPADWNAPLAELYRVARRSALHADELIEVLIAALRPSTPDQASVEDGALAPEPLD